MAAPYPFGSRGVGNFLEDLMSSAPRLESRGWLVAAALVLLLTLLPIDPGPVHAEDNQGSLGSEAIWNLIPAYTTGLIAVEADPEFGAMGRRLRVSWRGRSSRTSRPVSLPN